MRSIAASAICGSSERASAARIRARAGREPQLDGAVREAAAEQGEAVAVAAEPSRLLGGAEGGHRRARSQRDHGRPRDQRGHELLLLGRRRRRDRARSGASRDRVEVHGQRGANVDAGRRARGERVEREREPAVLAASRLVAAQVERVGRPRRRDVEEAPVLGDLLDVIAREQVRVEAGAATARLLRVLLGGQRERDAVLGAPAHRLVAVARRQVGFRHEHDRELEPLRAVDA